MDKEKIDTCFQEWINEIFNRIEELSKEHPEEVTDFVKQQNTTLSDSSLSWKQKTFILLYSAFQLLGKFNKLDGLDSQDWIDKIDKIDEKEGERIKISLDSLRATTATQKPNIARAKTKGRKLSAPGRNAKRAEEQRIEDKRRNQLTKQQIEEENKIAGKTEYHPEKLTQPQKKMFIALCGVAGKHIDSYKHIYATILRGGGTVMDAANSVLNYTINVTYEELEDIFFADKSKEHGTRNRATIVKLLNELSDYYYTYTSYTKNGKPIKCNRRLIVIDGDFQSLTGKKTEGLILRLSPHMLRNNLYGLNITSERLTELLTDICGRSETRTNAALFIIRSTGEYCADEDSIFRAKGLQALLATAAGIDKDKFLKLDKRRKAEVKSDVTATLDKLGVDKIKRKITSEKLEVTIAGLDDLAQRYFAGVKAGGKKTRRQKKS